RDIEQTDRVVGQYLILGAGNVDIVLLPANAPHPQPDDLVATQPAEQPGQHQGAEQFDRVFAANRVGVDVGVLEIEAGPQQLGPDVIGDDTGIRTDQGPDAAGSGQRPGPVERV